MDQLVNWKDRRLLPVIPKKDMKPGGYYLGRKNQRGMPLGVWDGRKQKFICIHQIEGYNYEAYEMNHIEDDNGLVCFEPVVLIEV